MSWIADASELPGLTGVDVLVGWAEREQRSKLWRLVSKQQHPDHGGDSDTFARLVEARDVLDAACKVTSS